MAQGEMPGRLVLVVEDYEDTRVMFRHQLELGGFRVVEAADGREAVERARAVRPDLILMDLNMPVLDGWEATRLIRLGAGTKHIPVVAISAQCGGDWRDRALAAGARECLQKPVDFATFDRLLERYPTLH